MPNINWELDRAEDVAAYGRHTVNVLLTALREAVIIRDEEALRGETSAWYRVQVEGLLWSLNEAFTTICAATNVYGQQRIAGLCAKACRGARGASRIARQRRRVLP